MRDWQPEFIDLWQQGLEITEIAQRLGVPNTTVVTNARSWYLGSGLTEGGWNHATDR